jgi:hypothetical protein
MNASLFKCAFAAALMLTGFGLSAASAADYHEPVYHEPVYQEPVYQEPVYQEPYTPPPQVYYQPPVYQPPVYQQTSCCGGCNRGLFTSLSLRSAPCQNAAYPQYQPYQYQQPYQSYPQYQQDTQYLEYPQYEEYRQAEPYPVYPRYRQPASYRYGARIAVHAPIFPRRMIHPRPVNPHCSMMHGRWMCR